MGITTTVRTVLKLRIKHDGNAHIDRPPPRHHEERKTFVLSLESIGGGIKWECVSYGLRVRMDSPRVAKETRRNRGTFLLPLPPWTENLDKARAISF